MKQQGKLIVQQEFMTTKCPHDRVSPHTALFGYSGKRKALRANISSGPGFVEPAAAGKHIFSLEENILKSGLWAFLQRKFQEIWTHFNNPNAHKETNSHEQELKETAGSRPQNQNHEDCRCKNDNVTEQKVSMESSRGSKKLRNSPEDRAHK